MRTASGQEPPASALHPARSRVIPKVHTQPLWTTFATNMASGARKERMGSVHLLWMSGWMRLHPFRVSGRTRESLQDGLAVVTLWDWAWQWSTLVYREEADLLDPRSMFISEKYTS